MATGGDNDLEGGNDEFFDNLCSVCTRKNKIKEAQKFCTDCQEYFCSICVNSHDDFPALRNHQILDKAKYQPGSRVQFPVIPTDRCTVHGHKPVDMYCRQHDVVGCSTCMVIQHSVCKDKVYIPDYVKSNTEVEHSSTIAKQLRTLASSLDQLQETFLQEKKNLKSQKETSMKEIRKLRIMINQQLDELEKNTLWDLEGVFQSLTDKIDAALRELQAAITQVKSTQNNLKSADSNLSQMFVSIKMANAVASQASETIRATQHQTSSTDISFVPTQKLQPLFSELQDLGCFSTTETPESQTRNPAALTSAAKTHTNIYNRLSSLSLLRIKNSKKYTVTENSYEETTYCAIVSVCALDDGTIILVDIAGNKLLRLDSSSYKVRDSCDVSFQPYQICAISNNEVAVCCNQDKLIQFVSVGHIMQKTRQIRTGVDCVGLAYADKKLFVSDFKTSVYVYSMTGEKLQQFSMPQLEDDNWLCHLQSLAVSSDGSTIYVAHSRNGLNILDRNGGLRECTDPKLLGACGVCLYKNNTVLVCGKDSNNVLQFSADGQLIGEVLKTNTSCMAICYCKKTSKLIVVIDDGIHVYDTN